MSFAFDNTISVSVIITVVSMLISGITFIVSLKGDIKVLKSQTSSLIQEVGELRRLHEQVVFASQDQSIVIKKVAEVAQANKKELKTHGAILKAALAQVEEVKSTNLKPVVEIDAPVVIPPSKP